MAGDHAIASIVWCGGDRLYRGRPRTECRRAIDPGRPSVRVRTVRTGCVHPGLHQQFAPIRGGAGRTNPRRRERLRRRHEFLNLAGSISSGGERGLLGMALSPDYAASGRFYVNFTDPAGNTVIARFLRSAGNPAVADAASRFDLQWPSGLKYIVQPYSNHNAGNLAFGPDGYLYIALGDGGSGDDPENRARNPAELLGKMLRSDVNVPVGNSNGYVVPPSNPFVTSGPAGVLKEIWAFGLRNPWRYSFDLPSP